MYRFVLTLTLAMLVFGCSKTRYVKTPPYDHNSESTKVKIVAARNWDFIGGGTKKWLTFDGTDVAGMYTREYTEFYNTEGSHTIGVRWYGGWNHGWNHSELKIDLINGEDRFFLISPKFLGLGNRRNRQR